MLPPGPPLGRVELAVVDVAAAKISQLQRPREILGIDIGGQRPPPVPPQSRIDVPTSACYAQSTAPSSLQASDALRSTPRLASWSMWAHARVSQVGVIAPGTQADQVLLNSSPLEHLKRFPGPLTAISRRDAL